MLVPCGIQQSARKVPRVGAASEDSPVDLENRSQTEAKRLPNGRFLPGTKPGPGRPPGSIDIFKTCRKRAKQEGGDLREMVWQQYKAMHEAVVEDRDAAACKILWDRTGGPVEKAGDVTVNVATQVNAGPPPPPTAELGAYLGRLVEVAREQGIELGGGGE